MEKLVYLFWAPLELRADRAAVRALAIATCAPRLLSLGPARLVIHTADPESRMRPPSPFGPKDPPPVSGTIDLWLADLDARAPFEAAIREAGLSLAGYHVEESIYRDYGGNRHAGPRDWPDGQRSPGAGVLTLLERPARLAPEEWVRRWHGTMSPVSEAIQPRTRYVRNRVLRPVTVGAPAIDGIVVEMFPSARHITNPLLFFGARNPVGLAINAVRIMRAVTSFHDLLRVRTTTVGEYFLKTGS